MMSNTCYLLLHVTIPPYSRPLTKKLTLAIRKASKEIGFKVWRVRLIGKAPGIDRADWGQRFMFSFPKNKRNDSLATKVAETILYPLFVMDPYLDHSPDESAIIFPVPSKLVRDQDNVRSKDLINLEEDKPPEQRILSFPTTTFSGYSYVPNLYLEAAWKIAPIIYNDEMLFQAIRFLHTSHSHFYFIPSRVGPTIKNSAWSPISSMDQSKMESALHYAFKAVEAVLGDPPKDDKKFFSRILSIGLQPEEIVGYLEKQPLHEVIRKMSEDRDKKAAHGSIAKKLISVDELVEYQGCSRFIVFGAIQQKLEADLLSLIL